MALDREQRVMSPVLASQDDLPSNVRRASTPIGVQTDSLQLSVPVAMQDDRN